MNRALESTTRLWGWCPSLPHTLNFTFQTCPSRGGHPYPLPTFMRNQTAPRPFGFGGKSPTSPQSRLSTTPSASAPGGSGMPPWSPITPGGRGADAVGGVGGQQVVMRGSLGDSETFRGHVLYPGDIEDQMSWWQKRTGHTMPSHPLTTEPCAEPLGT